MKYILFLIFFSTSLLAFEPAKEAIEGGAYTYTVYNSTCTLPATSATGTAYYFRVGRIVHVFISGAIDPPSSAGCGFEISLPIASDIVSGSLAGTAHWNNAANRYHARIREQTTNDRPFFDWYTPVDVGAVGFSGTFSYLVQ